MNNSEIADGGAQRQTLGLTTVSSRPLRSSLACSLFSFNKLITTKMIICVQNIFISGTELFYKHCRSSNLSLTYSTSRSFIRLFNMSSGLTEASAASRPSSGPLVSAFQSQTWADCVQAEEPGSHWQQGIINYFLISSLIWSNTSQKQMH